MEIKTNNIIYALKCPFTDNIHYIGKSTKGLLRPMEHLKESHSIKIKEWVNDIGQLGYSPKIDILESNIVSEEELNEKEKYWIAKCLSKGCLLLNEKLITYAKIINAIVVKEEKQTDSSEYSVITDVSLLSKRTRTQLKLTQADLSYKLGIGLRWLRKIEGGKNNDVMLNSLERFLKYLGFKLKLERI